MAQTVSEERSALHVRPDMQPRQAVYNMLQMLREAISNVMYKGCAALRRQSAALVAPKVSCPSIQLSCLIDLAA